MKSRQSDREAKESKSAAALLRQKVTELERLNGDLIKEMAEKEVQITELNKRDLESPDGLIRPLPTRLTHPGIMSDNGYFKCFNVLVCYLVSQGICRSV